MANVGNKHDSKHGITFLGIGTALPDRVVTNEELSQYVDTSDEWIYPRTGFKERRFVEENQTVADLAIGAAKDTLAFAEFDSADVDLIIIATSTPDLIYPATCCQVQAAIGAVNAFGFDISMGCSGFVYALNTAIQYIQNGSARNALVISSDIHSRCVDWDDRSTCVLFGDAAGGMLISRAEDSPNGHDNDELIAMHMMLDGRRGQQLTMPNYRPNAPMVKPRTLNQKPYVAMNGREVFKFAAGEMPSIVIGALDEVGLKPKDIDFYAFHQANIRIMDSIIERLGLRPEQLIISLENYSNTSAASTLLALNDAIKSGQLTPGSSLYICGFGAGLSAASVILKWNAVDKRLAATKTTGQAEPELVSSKS